MSPRSGHAGRSPGSHACSAWATPAPSRDRTTAHSVPSGIGSAAAHSARRLPGPDRGARTLDLPMGTATRWRYAWQARRIRFGSSGPVLPLHEEAGHDGLSPRDGTFPTSAATDAGLESNPRNGNCTVCERVLQTVFYDPPDAPPQLPKEPYVGNTAAQPPMVRAP